MRESTRPLGETSSVQARPALRWAILVLTLLALILVPFGLFGARFEEWSLAFLEQSRTVAGVTRAIVIGLLAGDVFLPVPSSAVSTFAGASLGFWDGFVTSTVGMTAGCVFGYTVGKLFGRQAAVRMIGEDQLRLFEGAARRWGDWVLIATRAVPVLAEASALAGGMSRMPIGRFLARTLLANAGISAVYSAVGAFAVSQSSFLLAFGGAVSVPALALLVHRGMSRNPQPAGQP